MEQRDNSVRVYARMAGESDRIRSGYSTRSARLKTPAATTVKRSQVEGSPEGNGPRGRRGHAW